MSPLKSTIPQSRAARKIPPARHHDHRRQRTADGGTGQYDNHVPRGHRYDIGHQGRRYLSLPMMPLGTNTLSLSGVDAALFQIVGTELFLVAGASLDFEANPVLDVTVEVDDAAILGSPEDIAPLAITITDVNEPPTVALANTTTTFPKTPIPPQRSRWLTSW